MIIVHKIESLAQTQELCIRLAPLLKPGAVVYLRGELGAGKTVLARYVLEAMGFAGKVKSPTYALVEPYQIASQRCYHFDLYRVHDDEELLAIGIADYFDGSSIVFIEWPERADQLLPAATVEIELEKTGKINERTIKCVASSIEGVKILEAMQ